MSFTNIPSSHPFGLRAVHQALAEAELPCLVLVVMDHCPACERMKGAIQDVEDKMLSGQGPPGSVVVVESQIARQSDHPALSGEAVPGYPSANVIERDGYGLTAVPGRSSDELLDALALATAAHQGQVPTHSPIAESGDLKIHEEPSILASGVPSSVAVKKKKRKKTKSKKSKKKKKGGGTRRRGRGGRTRRSGGRRVRRRQSGGSKAMGCGCP